MSPHGPAAAAAARQYSTALTCQVCWAGCRVELCAHVLLAVFWIPPLKVQQVSQHILQAGLVCDLWPTTKDYGVAAREEYCAPTGKQQSLWSAERQRRVCGCRQNVDNIAAAVPTSLLNLSECTFEGDNQSASMGHTA
jgi:hypothetical protein